jgi:Gpi18-like mannosyltransferase
MTPLTGSDGLVWGPWQRWDTIWYTKIAEQGYSSDDLSTAFFPLYPLLIRLTSTLVSVNSVAAGLIVSSIAALGAFTWFYHMTREQYGEKTAQNALLWLAVIPTAFFLFAAYTESLFMFFAIGSWWFGQKQQWEFAGLMGGLAALTRPQGLLLAFPLAFIFLMQFRHRQVSSWRAANLLPVVGGGLLFVAYVFQLNGSLTAWFEIEAQWRQYALPWQTIWQSLLEIWTSGDVAVGLVNALDLGLTLLFLGLVLWAVRQKKYAESIYLAIIIFPPLFTIARFNPFLPLASISRFLVVAFPGFVLLAGIEVRESILKVLVGLSLLIQTFLLILFTHWIFVG